MPKHNENIHKVNIIGTMVNVGRLSEYSETILEWAVKKQSRYVCVANTHMLVYRKLYPYFGDVLDKAGLVVPDGGPLVKFIKTTGYEFQERAAGYDLTLSIMALCQDHELSVGFFGSSSEELYNAEKTISKIYPKLKINLLLAPPIFKNPDEIEYLLDDIQKSKCQLLFVCLGCPKQENWMRRYSNTLNMPLIGIGGAIDLLSQKYKLAPEFMRNHSLEWLYRLYMEPKRLWKRYLIYNSLYIFYIIQSSLVKLLKKEKNITPD